MKETIFVSEKTGRIIYGMRNRLNCTQAEFGKKIGLSQPEMSAIELGKVAVKPETVQKIADRFGINPMAITGQVPMNWASLC